MAFALARSALERVKDAAAPLTDNAITRTVAAAPGAVLGATRDYIVEPVADAVVNLPSTAVAAPKLVLEAVKNTTTVISVGVKGALTLANSLGSPASLSRLITRSDAARTASALNPFGFVHKLTKGATIGIGVAVGLIVFIILLCCLIALWRCVRGTGRRESQSLLYQTLPFRKGGHVPYYTMYQAPAQEK